MHAEIGVYVEDWERRDEKNNFAQKHDVELAKRSIRETPSSVARGKGAF